jgi:hypothetical protein
MLRTDPFTAGSQNCQKIVKKMQTFGTRSLDDVTPVPGL